MVQALQSALYLHLLLTSQTPREQVLLVSPFDRGEKRGPEKLSNFLKFTHLTMQLAEK